MLGPLNVHTADGPVAVTGRHHPRLLALLLADANRAVSTDRLVAGLWDDSPPETARRQVQNIAAALRRQLGIAGGRLRKIGAGYQFDVEVDELDLLRSKRAEFAALDHRAAGRLAAAEEALEEALAEWRGPSLAGLTGRAVEAAARRLDDYRLSLTEERIGLGLMRGRHDDLLPELQRLHEEHPYRELVAEQLMTALYRSGQSPEALRVYAAVSARLADELGTDPAKPLRDLHAAILREDPQLNQRPREAIAPVTLPSGTAAFTGREECLAALDEAADSASQPLVVLSGVGGVGKTMLALHWGHRAAARFPGGRLYVDLRGFAPTTASVEPSEAVRVLLGSLGIDPRRIPADEASQIALYRNVIGSEPRLLILDNARNAAQLRPLLPNTPDVQTVVISRHRLTGLVASHGARIIEVGTMSDSESTELVRQRLGPDRLAAEPEATDRILTACAGLPLALAVTVARAATRPAESLGAIAEQLETSRLDALVGDEASVDLRAVFSWSYRQLDADAARLFRLLGGMPGPDFCVESATMLHGEPPEGTAAALHRLVEAHLAEPGRDGRYRLHDLVRHYAAELLEREEPESGREAARRRLLEWFVHGAEACRTLLYPEQAALPGADVASQVWEQPIATDADAAQWMKAEWTNLVAAVELAAARGPSELSWRLADAMRGYIWLGMLGSDGPRVARAALEAARQDDGHLGRASAELGMAYASIRSFQLRCARDHALDAVDLARRADWTAGVAAAEFNLAAVAFYRGGMREGIRHCRAALTANRSIGARHAQCTNLHWLGIFHSLVGELTVGAERFDQALAVATEIGADSAKAVLLTHRAETDLFRGRLDEAGRCLAEARELERKGLGFDHHGDVAGATARLHLASGRCEDAADGARSVLEKRTGAADRRIRTHAVVTLADALDAAGLHLEAVATYDRALAMTEHEPTEFHRAQALVGRAASIWRSGDVPGARDAAEQALRTAKDGDYRFLEAQATNRLAEIDLDASQLEMADARAKEALRICQETGHRPGEAESLRILAGVARARGSEAAATELGDDARALHAQIGSPVPADLGRT